MKYMISESRLDNIIEMYLDSIFEPHEIANIPEFGSVVVKNGEVIALISDGYWGEGDKRAFIKRSIQNSVGKLFSLSKDDAFEKIEKYFDKKFGFHWRVGFSDMVYNQGVYDDWLKNQ